ncbi:hypothetical protein CFP65_2882 [Kitasatospora sp. MMS16-BH015]|uniref:hypothetical protein n=1 Tax=Kitasatospora sp. MMS16-BH015 TaxID=2018025 RepID=UPI000CA2309E|nr:hypothetical protein [Kitasatospora sp. MMS16-BH015]AUG77695.1 hypothetical protein CFP65_2882 [Kitasatospora sp. MMS16-BH015]
MYLVHMVLVAASTREMPDRLGELISSAARPEDRLEHLSVHLSAPGRLVVGAYLLAERLEEAERRAVALCDRALSTVPELRGWRLVDAGVPLLAPFYEGLL